GFTPLRCISGKRKSKLLTRTQDGSDVTHGAHSPPRRGGVAAALIKSRRSRPKRRRRGGAKREPDKGEASGAVWHAVVSAELLLRLRPVGLALRATPSAPIRNGIFFLMARPPPPLRGGELPRFEALRVRRRALHLTGFVIRLT